MLISLLVLLVLAASGAALTYMLVDDEPLMWRLAAGSIIGWAAFGLAAFVIACLIGFSTGALVLALAVTMLMLACLRPRDRRERFWRDWAKAKGTFQGASVKKGRRFAYYAFFF